MTLVRWQPPFSGKRPAVDDYALGTNGATTSTHARFDRLGLQAHYANAVDHVAAPATPTLTIFAKSATKWFEWTEVRDVVRSPIGNDAHGRTYFTNSAGNLQVTDAVREGTTGVLPSASLDVGVPAPGVAPALTVIPLPGSPPISPEDVPDLRYYVTTYVNSYGEEGPNSKVSVEKTVYETAQSVNVTIPAAPSGAVDITAVNLYRSNISGELGGFQLVAIGLPPGQPYNDAIASAALGQLLPSETWDPPPASVTNLIAGPTGYLIANVGNQLVASVRDKPHAWPVEYQRPVPDSDSIVALATLGTSIVVLTDTGLYLANGVDPAAIELSDKIAQYGCVAKRSVVEFPGHVFYASNDGLVDFTVNGAANALNGVVDITAWRNMNPSTMVAGRYHTGYLCAYTVGTTQYAFFFDLNERTFTDITVPGQMPQIYYDEFSGGKVLTPSTVAGVGQSTVYELMAPAGAAGSGTWKSGPRVFEAPIALNFIQVMASTYPVSIIVARDGISDVVNVPSVEPIRLPRAPRSVEVSITATLGASTIRRVSLAETVKELM